ncbi:DUF3796 domain-containing protein [Stomatohabitans albus]|uniref:DUF3796 domain-containing protein n=1 Tax=Stomatohabitans albus TaxID=3110766 RepID=UPI00300D5A0E
MKLSFDKWFWCVGFLGFLSFKYLFSHKIDDLIYASFFAFFAFFFLRNVNGEIEDEMYHQHMLEASRLSFMILLYGMFSIPYLIVIFDLSRTVIVAVAMGLFVVSLLLYAFKLNNLERG